MTEAGKNITITSLPENERPREKLKNHGVKALSNAELLAILLRTGTKNESALSLSYKILSKNGGIKFLGNAKVTDFNEISGIGLAKASQLIAAVELGKRIAQYSYNEDIYVKKPQDAADMLMEEMRYYKKEHMKIIMLNVKCKVIGVEEISIGSLNSSLAHPREIFIPAIKNSSANIILTHNHPSGDPAPSKDDIEITQRVYEAGKILGIELYDHIIIGDGVFISLKEKGLF
jgi:DNA repair protein RadC